MSSDIQGRATRAEERGTLQHTCSRRMVVKESSASFIAKESIPYLSSLTDLTRVQAPGRYSIKSGMSPVRNQLDGGFCCTFAVAAALEYSNGAIDLSESHLTDGAERKYDDCQEGLAIATAMQFCVVEGVVQEVYWPYDPHQVCWKTPPNITGRPRFSFKKIAVLYQRQRAEIVDTMRLTLDSGKQLGPPSVVAGPSIESIRAALLRVAVPVVVEVPVWFTGSGQFDAGWEVGPDVQMPSPIHLENWLKSNSAIPPGIAGWHAIPICGYDDSLGRFEFKNSWGGWWGTAGYGTIPYEYILSYSTCGMQGWN